MNLVDRWIAADARHQVHKAASSSSSSRPRSDCSVDEDAISRASRSLLQAACQWAHAGSRAANPSSDVFPWSALTKADDASASSKLMLARCIGAIAPLRTIQNVLMKAVSLRRQFRLDATTDVQGSCTASWAMALPGLLWLQNKLMLREEGNWSILMVNWDVSPSKVIDQVRKLPESWMRQPKPALRTTESQPLVGSKRPRGQGEVQLGAASALASCATSSISGALEGGNDLAAAMGVDKEELFSSLGSYLWNVSCFLATDTAAISCQLDGDGIHGILPLPSPPEQGVLQLAASVAATILRKVLKRARGIALEREAVSTVHGASSSALSWNQSAVQLSSVAVCKPPDAYLQSTPSAACARAHSVAQELRSAIQDVWKQSHELDT